MQFSMGRFDWDMKKEVINDSRDFFKKPWLFEFVEGSKFSLVASKNLEDH